MAIIAGGLGTSHVPMIGRTIAANKPGVEDVGAYAHGIGRDLNPADRAALVERIEAGESPEDAAAWLADPFRGLTPSERPGVDPVAVQAARDAAGRREEATQARLAEMAAIKPAAPPKDLRTHLRPVADPASEASA